MLTFGGILTIKINKTSRGQEGRKSRVSLRPGAARGARKETEDAFDLI